MAKQIYRMTDAQYCEMMNAMHEASNQRVMYGSGGVPLFDDPQEIANRAWKKLSGELGFVWDSAGPGPDDHSFKAEPAE